MEHFFDSRDEASIAAATRILRNLQTRLKHQRAASLIVSGGTTPVRCFEALADSDIDWSRVQLLLSDERYVPPTDAGSNEKLLRETLLQKHAAAATLWPYYDASSDPAERCVALEDTLRTLPIPFACALLGMGEDGHFASLFADASGLEDGLDADHPTLCMPVSTVASPHPRITLTLAALSRSDEVVLLIFGDSKREVYEQALTPGSSLPVAKLLKQKRAPVHVFWAP